MEQTKVATLHDRSTATYQPPVPKELKYCLYARKSTESDERQALSIDSQIKEMLELAQRDKLNVVEVRRESHSAKDSAARPVFNQLLGDVRAGKFNSILTWAPDRLSRNAGDLGSLVDLMDQKLLHEIRTYSQKFTNNPNEKFLLMILCSQAKLENDNKGLNVKRGLKTKAELGLWSGIAPTGYLNENRADRKGYILVDPKRAPIVKQMFEKVGYDKWSGRKLYHWLKEDLRFATRYGKPLSLSNIYNLLANSFYTGIFEYPKGSNRWYTGKHTPLITKELYDLVQQHIKIDRHVKYASKEFAFTKLITCGACGSGITAMEKFKKLKDGTTNRYIYYGCTRARDLNCKGGYLREEDLISQFITLIDKLSVDELGIRHQLEQEVERYHRFNTKVLKTSLEPSKALKDVDIKNYAKYLLGEGTVMEKRQLLACMKSRLALKDKNLMLTDR